MKSVVLVVASLLALGSALPLPEEEAQGKPQGFTAEQLQLLFSANPEDNDIDLSEPEPNPLPLNLNQRVEEEVVPVPAEDGVEEIQEQQVPKETDESQDPPEAEEPVAPEEKDTKETPDAPEEQPVPAEDNVEEAQEQEVPEETPEQKVPAASEEPVAPEDYVAPEEPVIIDVPVAPLVPEASLEPVVDEEPQTPDGEIFEVPDRYRIPLFPEDPGYDSYSTVEQEPIIEVIPVEEAGLVGVIDGDEDFSDEDMEFENDEPDQEPVEGMVAGSIIVDQDGVVIGSEPVVVGYVDRGYPQEPITNEDDVSEEDVFDEEPQVVFVPENEEEMVDEEGVPVEVVVSPEYQPEVEFENPEYPVPVVGTVFVEDDQEEPEENNEGVYFIPSEGTEGFATDERDFEIKENPGSAFFIPDNEPQEVIDPSPLTSESFVVPVDEDGNPEVLVVGEDAEGDHFALAVEEDENGEIQREVLVAEIAEEDSSEETVDDLPMEEAFEDEDEEGPVDGMAILAVENENGEEQPEVLVAEMPAEPLSGEPIDDDVPVREVFVVEEKGPNEEVIALAVEDENGDIHGEIIDAEVDGEGFPSEPLPVEGPLPEGIFAPEEDSSEEVFDLEVDVDEDGEVHVVGVPETEDMFSEDVGRPLVGLSDVMDEERDEEPYPVMPEENDEEEVLPIEVTPEKADGEEPFLVMRFEDDIVPVIAPAEENYPEGELRPLPPVAEYPFSPDMPMEPEEDIVVIPEEMPFGMEVIPDEIHPEEIGDDDEDEEAVFESDPAMMVPGVIPDPMEEPETPEVFFGPKEIVEIIPYDDNFEEGNRPIIFPDDDVPSHNLPVFPYRFVSRVASIPGGQIAGDDEGYYSAEEMDEDQKPFVTRPLIGEAKEPQVLQIPDKTSNNLLPIAGIPSQSVQQQQPQVSMFPQNQNQYQRYSPAFTDDQFQINRNAQNPMSSSYVPYPFQSQYVPKYPQVSTYFDVFNRQPYDVPQSYDRYTHDVFYDSHTHDDDTFYDDHMHDDVPVYFEQPTYYNTRRLQNPFYNYKGYAASSVPSYNEYSPYTYNYYRPTVY